MPDQAPSRLPTTRNLPARTYGHFDIHELADGSKRYALPHTLTGTAQRLALDVRLVTPLLIVAVIAARKLAPIGTGLQIGPTVFYAALLFLLLHAALTLLLMLLCAVSGHRALTHVAIRQDGLIWGDRVFFPAADIYMVGYGRSENAGKPDEVFIPKLEIQLGTRMITLADRLDPTAAKLFERMFGDDTRRFWHHHN